MFFNAPRIVYLHAILQCGSLVLNSVGAIIDKITVADLFVPVVIWLLM